MKATLEFSLPEEEAEHRLALDGAKWQGVVASLDQKLRSLEKYHEGEDSERAAWARRLLHELLDEYRLEIL